MPPEVQNDHPPICDYEGSDYQQRFWEQGERQYEDQVEAVAIRRLLPSNGKLLLEVGAGAGRNTPRYHGYQRIVVMDYSTTQLEQAQQRLGTDPRYIYVAADVYKLPFVDGLFDGVTMIRVIHHLAEAPRALAQLRQVMQPRGVFLLEFANKRNLKAILRYWAGRQTWNPFTPEQVEYIPLNFDFHPHTMRGWLKEAGFRIERQLSVSHFRMGWLKRNIPLGLLVGADAALQPTGALWQYTPSLFYRMRANDQGASAGQGFFKCPECGTPLPEQVGDVLACPGCQRRWGRVNGIYNFKSSS
ncbi:MAG: methyltransferase domain-containing protein [Anaerolineales bacterium]|nr:methyltransferase domain-containing protein [Anaerolineales bacterium]